MFKRFVTLFLILASAQIYGQKTIQITVSNSGDARRNSIISFPYTSLPAKKNLEISDKNSNRRYPVQVLPGGEAFSIIDISHIHLTSGLHSL